MKSDSPHLGDAESALTSSLDSAGFVDLVWFLVVEHNQPDVLRVGLSKMCNFQTRNAREHVHPRNPSLAQRAIERTWPCPTRTNIQTDAILQNRVLSFEFYEK